MRPKLVKLLKIIDVELSKAEIVYKKTKNSAQEISALSMSSYSHAGDLYHSETTAEMTKDRFEMMANLKKEIENNIEESIPDVVKPPCFIRLDITDLYLVDNPVYIKNQTLVSPQSSLGLSLMGKKIGDEVHQKTIKEIG